MSFNSIIYLFIFLPLSLVVYYLTPKKYRLWVLFGSGLLFYSWQDPKYVFLLLVLTLWNYYMNMRIKLKHQRINLIETLVVNLIILAYFKYYGFILDNIFHIVPIKVHYQLFDMPLGISFYMFSLLAYHLDVYWKKSEGANSLAQFGAYICFFPKLLMGPIERFNQMQEGFNKCCASVHQVEEGFTRLLIGLIQKLVLANSFASIYASLNATSISFMSAWMMMIAYAFQIYFDFQGYSQMAIGSAKLFGFNLMENFNYPYVATSITNFWRRWHISLSSFFKDYVYIPLGGNRKGVKIHIRNIMIVWMLTGLWHGSSWNFVLWGLYYGLLLLVEKYFLTKYLKQLPFAIQWLYSAIAVLIGWVFFASSDVSHIIQTLSAMFSLPSGLSNQHFVILQGSWLYFLIAILWMTPLFHNIGIYFKKMKRDYWWIKMILFGLGWLLVLIYLLSDSFQAFLYFAF